LLARKFHPDQHPWDSPAELAAWSAAMASVEEAWDELREPARREQHRAEHVRIRESASTRVEARSPIAGECDLCGSAPAIVVALAEQRAWVVRARTLRSRLELCRSCGLALGRSRQNRTLLAGWWGFLSFFRNLSIVGGNAAALRSLARLGPPCRDAAVAASIPEPLPTGRPVVRRAGLWVTAGLLVVVAGGAAAVGVHTNQQAQAPATTSPRPGVESVAHWQVGNCVTGGETKTPVGCSAAHSGRIVLFTSTPAGCPTGYDSTVADGDGVWCIEDEQ
jgi:hypothetical protein